MLWTLFKTILFFVLVAVASLGASLLIDTSGGVRIVLGSIEINMSPLMSVIALMGLMAIVLFLLKALSLLGAVFSFLAGNETALSRFMERNRQGRGFRALSEALTALASGEGAAAIKKAERAGRLLGKPELANLITAQAAEVAGDRRRAEEAYKALIRDRDTRFVGVHGIMRHRLSDGDADTALKLAETAYALKPRHGEMQDAVLLIRARRRDWVGAREVLHSKLRCGNLPRDVHRRRDAVLAVGQARDLLESGNAAEAHKVAIEANKLSPDLIPAAVMASRAHVAGGATRHAARVLSHAWRVQPHPDIASAMAEIEPGESPARRIKRLRKMLRIHPGHRETKLIEAELNIAAGDFSAARAAMGNVALSEPDARALAIMAAIEREAGGSDAEVRGWLAKSLSAPRGPQWVCDRCQHIHGRWEPVCTSCEALDTLSWKTPPSGSITSMAGVEVVPLIVGTAEAQLEAADAEAQLIGSATLGEAGDAESAGDAGSQERDDGADSADSADSADGGDPPPPEVPPEEDGPRLEQDPSPTDDSGAAAGAPDAAQPPKPDWVAEDGETDAQDSQQRPRPDDPSG